MFIKVNMSELQSKSSYAKSIASRLGEEASQLNKLYYDVDSKVRNRQSIGSSIKSLQQRLERAQKKMYNVSSFLTVAAAQYSDAESIIIEEYKASSTAPLTKNQKIAHPEIETDGGIVVGKGKPPFIGGTEIPPTKIKIIRRK